LRRARLNTSAVRLACIAVPFREPPVRRLLHPLLMGFASFALSPAPASAEVHAGAFLQMVEEQRWSARTYLMGVMTALTAANTVAQRELGRRLYCPPADQTLSPDQQLDLLTLYLGHVPADEDLPLSQAVVKSMVQIYPCASRPSREG
jgi:hypothetical protein